jgi:hypothetical protein
MRLGSRVYGPGEDFLVPRRIEGISHAIYLTSGRDATCAHSWDSDILCWGLTPDGSVLPRPTSFDVSVPFRQISLGAHHWCAVDGGNSLF